MHKAEKFIHQFQDLLKQKRLDKVFGRFGFSDEWDEKLRKIERDTPRYSVEFSEAALRGIMAQKRALEDKFGAWKDLWKMIIRLNKHPLPEDIAVQLANDNFHGFADLLATTDQTLEVYFAAADTSKNARSRLCIRLFTDPTYSVADFEKFLEKYGKKGALRVLENRKANPSEKIAVFSASEQSLLTNNYMQDLPPEQISKIRKNHKRSVYIAERQAEEKRIQSENDD